MGAALEVVPPADDMLPALLDSVRRYCADTIDATAIDKQAKIPREVLSGMAELGLFGLTLPEAYGGSGLSMVAAARVVAEIARFDRSVATSVGLHLGLGTRGLIAFGSEALKARYLPDLAAGKKIAAFSTTEPNAGSDLSNLATRGAADGEGLVVNGEKIFVTNGGFADVFTLTVATPGLGGYARGQSLVLFERGDQGFSVGKEEWKLGLKGSSTTPLVLEDVRVPQARIIGAPGKGADQLHHVLSWGRTLMAAGCCGTAQRAFERMREQTATRKQFGKTLDALEVVQEQLALSAARLFAMEALALSVCAQEADFEALGVRSLAAKVFCSEGAGLIADTCIQLHGGSGFIEETGVPVLARDARVTRIFEGANDVLLTHMGAAESMVTATRAPLAGTVGVPLEKAARLADGLAAEVAAQRTELVGKYKVALLRHKRLLHRLGAAVCWRDALDAAVARAAASRAQADAALATLFAELAKVEAAKFLTPPVPLDAITAALAAAPGASP